METRQDWESKVLPPAHGKLYTKAGALLKPLITPVQKGVIKNTIHNVSVLSLSNGRRQKLPLLSYSREGYADCFFRSAIYERNAYFGLEVALQEYCGWRKPIKAKIEHGLFLGSYVNDFEASLSGLPALMTFGPVRASRIHATSDIPVIQLGPYIQYVRPYVSAEELAKLQRDLGKVLLVFPTHSINDVALELDIAELKEKADDIAKRNGVDTVLYCLFFNEVNHGMATVFENLGCRVVCAGHRMDPDFLPRLRSLIELSQITASNSIGTHIGYCAALNRRHILFSSYSRLETALPEGFDWGKMAEYDRIREADSASITEAFSEKARKETALSVGADYWGCGLCIPPEKMNELFGNLDDAYRLMRGENMTAQKALKTVAPDLPKDLKQIVFADES